MLKRKSLTAQHLRKQADVHCHSPHRSLVNNCTQPASQGGASHAHLISQTIENVESLYNMVWKYQIGTVKPSFVHSGLTIGVQKPNVKSSFNFMNGS